MRPAFPFPSVWCGGTRKHLEFTRVCHVVHVCYAASNGRSGSYSATRSGFRIKFVSSFTFGCLFLLHLLFFLLFLFCLPSPLPQHRIIGLNNMKHEIDINIRNWTAAKQHSLPPPIKSRSLSFNDRSLIPFSTSFYESWIWMNNPLNWGVCGEAFNRVERSPRDVFKRASKVSAGTIASSVSRLYGLHPNDSRSVYRSC